MKNHTPKTIFLLIFSISTLHLYASQKRGLYPFKSNPLRQERVLLHTDPEHAEILKDLDRVGDHYLANHPRLATTLEDNRKKLLHDCKHAENFIRKYNIQPKTVTNIFDDIQASAIETCKNTVTRYYQNNQTTMDASDLLFIIYAARPYFIAHPLKISQPWPISHPFIFKIKGLGNISPIRLSYETPINKMTQISLRREDDSDSDND